MANSRGVQRSTFSARILGSFRFFPGTFATISAKCGTSPPDSQPTFIGHSTSPRRRHGRSQRPAENEVECLLPSFRLTATEPLWVGLINRDWSVPVCWPRRRILDVTTSSARVPPQHSAGIGPYKPSTPRPKNRLSAVGIPYAGKRFPSRLVSATSPAVERRGHLSPR